MTTDARIAEWLIATGENKPTTAPDVLAGLDDVIAGLKFGGNKSDAAELESILTRIAALVEAAKGIDRLVLVIESCVRHDGSPSELSIVRAALKANETALRGIGR